MSSYIEINYHVMSDKELTEADHEAFADEVIKLAEAKGYTVAGGSILKHKKDG